MNPFFITGTNTEVGKTWTSRALLLAAHAKGLRTIALKPVAAGCERTSEGLRNEDALLLQQVMTEPLAYDQVNPVALEPAIAPYIAAEQIGRALSVDALAQHCADVLRRPHDFALIEGAGGWRVPLNNRETLADLAIALQTPVILIVGMSLGCLNHALLTAEAIERDGLTLAGWIANSPSPAMDCLEQNVATLNARLSVPCLGQVPFLAGKTPEEASRYLMLNSLWGGC
jgi:dethiobiotin synthetase